MVMTCVPTCTTAPATVHSHTSNRQAYGWCAAAARSAADLQAARVGTVGSGLIHMPLLGLGLNWYHDDDDERFHTHVAHGGEKEECWFGQSIGQTIDPHQLRRRSRLKYTLVPEPH